MKKILLVVMAVMGMASPVLADSTEMSGKTCGQMLAEKAALPAKMAEMMTAVAEMADAHAAYMLTTKTKEGKVEAAALKKMSAQHRKLAVEFKKTAAMMEKMATLPGATHDMAAMHADPAIQASMQHMMTTHEEMAALLNKEVAWMKSMGGAPAKTDASMPATGKPMPAKTGAPAAPAKK